MTPAEIEKLPSGISAVRELQDLTVNPLPQETINTIIGVTIALICLALLIGVIFIILGYVSQTALIRMVDPTKAAARK
jgi:hypothetical protein